MFEAKVLEGNLLGVMDITATLNYVWMERY